MTECTNSEKCPFGQCKTLLWCFSVENKHYRLFYSFPDEIPVPANALCYIETTWEMQNQRLIQ